MATRQEIEIHVVDKTQRGLNNIQKRLGNIERNTGNLQKGFGGVTKAAGAFVAVLGAREILEFGKRIIDTTAQFQNYTNQLRLITDGQEDLNRTFALLTQAAKDNRTSFGATVDLYTKLRISTEALGFSTERVLKVTGNLSKALQVAGADGNTAASVIRQFGQAMASGEVRGDEFRSLVEGLGPALAIMARETGLTVGELRRMSQAGELSAEVMFEMLENSNALAASFNRMQPTIDQLETALSDAFDRALVKLGELTGLSDGYSFVIERITRELDQFAETAGAISNIPDIKIFEGIEEGSITASDALKEFEARLDEAKTAGIFPVLIETDRIKELKEYIATVKVLADEQAIAAEAAEKLRKAEEERIAALNAIIKPYESVIDLGEKYSKMDFASPLAKAQRDLESAKDTLIKLEEAQSKLDASGFNEDGFKDLSAEIEGTRNAVAGLTEKVNELAKSDYTKFLEDVKERTQENLDQQQYTSQAITEISALYRDGAVSLEYYTEAMEILSGATTKHNSTLKETESSLESLNNKYQEYLQTPKEIAKSAYEEDLQSFKDALDLKVISHDEYMDYVKAANEALADELDQIEEARLAKDKARNLERINDILKTNKAILDASDQATLQKIGDEERAEAQAQRLREFYKKSEYEKYQFAVSTAADALTELGRYNKQAFQAAKALRIAEAIMNTYAGVTAALKYPPPFSFIAAGAQLAFGLAQVATIRSQTYQGRQRGGALGIGQTAVVGEDGPELIVPKQPSTVIPREVAQAIEGMGSGRDPVVVNFNITTVDAESFDTLLIRRRGTITSIINGALQKRGKEGVV